MPTIATGQRTIAAGTVVILRARRMAAMPVVTVIATPVTAMAVATFVMVLRGLTMAFALAAAPSVLTMLRPFDAGRLIVTGFLRMTGTLVTAA